MRLSEFRNKLETISDIVFILPDGSSVPAHFHITEVGQVIKNFIDCGGQIRNESTVSMQLWESVDTWHRLTPGKLISIIELSRQKLGIGDNEVEIEYQGETIGRYRLGFMSGKFRLIPTTTACLAEDQCGIPAAKTKKNLSELAAGEKGCCSPQNKCC
jgi:hypothetical protein